MHERLKTQNVHNNSQKPRSKNASTVHQERTTHIHASRNKIITLLQDLIDHVAANPYTERTFDKWFIPQRQGKRTEQGRRSREALSTNY